MKKIFESKLFCFVLGAIIFSGITVYASTTYLSNQVSFTPTNSVWNVNNVEDALNILYDRTDLNLSLYSSDNITGTITTSRKLNLDITNGEYLLVVNVYNAGETFTGLNSTATLSSNGNVSFEKIESEVSGYSTTHSASSALIIYDVVCFDESATITIDSDDAGINSIAGAGTNYILIKK